MTDKKTAHLSLPLPDSGNALAEDCPRLAEALTALDGYAQTADERLDDVEADIATLLTASERDETITGVKTFTSTIVGDLSGTAAKATADSDGAAIAVTYLKKADLEDIYVRTTVTLSDALKAGTPVEVPKHTVGGDGMAVYLCGVLCRRGENFQYLDVDSTHISFVDDLEAGMDIAVVSFK